MKCLVHESCRVTGDRVARCDGEIRQLVHYGCDSRQFLQLHALVLLLVLQAIKVSPQLLQLQLQLLVAADLHAGTDTDSRAGPGGPDGWAREEEEDGGDSLTTNQLN